MKQAGSELFLFSAVCRFLLGLLFSPEDEAACFSKTVDSCWTMWHYAKERGEGGHDHLLEICTILVMFIVLVPGTLRGLQVLKKKLIAALRIRHKVSYSVMTCVTVSNRCIPEARILHNYSCENLKSYFYGPSSENCPGCLIEFEQMNARNSKFHHQCFKHGNALMICQKIMQPIWIMKHFSRHCLYHKQVYWNEAKLIIAYIDIDYTFFS
jgi:hypothetical protein